MKRTFVVLGMQFGDEAKGVTVDFLCEQHEADLVVRYSGGYQSQHNVVRGTKHHAFRQFGSGTFLGVPTLLGPEFIFCPMNAWVERELIREQGCDPQPLRVSPECLVVNPYSLVLNRARMANGHGTTGCGIGETRRYWLQYGQDAIVANDLFDNQLLRRKLRLARHRCRLELSTMAIQDQPGVASMLADIDDGRTIERWQNDSYCVDHLMSMPMDGTVVFEGSQGLLLDEHHGFHPHTSWSDLTTKPALDMIPSGTATTTIGCIRAFTTRHGQGPLPSECSQGMPVEPHNEGGHPGQFRWGLLDIPLLRYSLKVQPVDYLAVSWLDQVTGRQILHDYEYNVYDKMPEHLTLPSIDGQTKNTAYMNEQADRPHAHEYRTIKKEPDLLDYLDGIQKVGIEGRGPTAADRIDRTFCQLV